MCSALRLIVVIITARTVMSTRRPSGICNYYGHNEVSLFEHNKLPSSSLLHAQPRQRRGSVVPTLFRAQRRASLRAQQSAPHYRRHRYCVHIHDNADGMALARSYLPAEHRAKPRVVCFPQQDLRTHYSRGCAQVDAPREAPNDNRPTDSCPLPDSFFQYTHCTRKSSPAPHSRLLRSSVHRALPNSTPASKKLEIHLHISHTARASDGFLHIVFFEDCPAWHSWWFWSSWIPPLGLIWSARHDVRLASRRLVFRNS